MSKKLQLMILAGSLVGALGIFVVMNNAEEEVITPVVDDSVTLIDLDEEEVEKIVITQGDKTLTLTPIIVQTVTQVAPEESTTEEDAEIEEENTDDNAVEEAEVIIEEDIDWEIQEGKDLDLDSYSIEGFARDTLMIEASRSVDQVDLEAFGLSESDYEVTYFLKDGTQTTLTIGEKSLDGSSAYVMKDNETDIAYLVPSYEIDGFKEPLEHYRKDMLENIDVSLLTEMTVSGEEMDTFYFYPAEQQFIGGEFMMQVNNADPMPAAYDPMQQSLQAIPMFNIQSFIEENVSDLSLYGLDEPSLRATFVQKVSAESTETKQITYIWGEDYGTDEIYFMEEGGTAVYTMRKLPVEEWVSTLDPFSMIEKMGMMVHIDDVDHIKVSHQDNEYTLKVEREEVVVEPEETEATEEGEEVESEIEIVEMFYIDEQKVSEDLFRDLYAMTIGMKMDIILDVPVDTDQIPEAQMTFVFNDGTEKAYSFYPYNDQFYAYQLSDTVTVGWNIKQFEYLVKNIEEVLQAPEIED